jgi:putrescine transport system permease protein
MKKLFFSILNSPLWTVVLPYIWLVLFFLIPFLIVLKISLSEFIIALPPYDQMFSWTADGALSIKATFENYKFILQDSLYVWAYIDSIKIAISGALLCLAIGYPIAYGISKSPEKYRLPLLMLVILPFWTSFLLRVFSWVGILGPKGILNALLIYIGIIESPLHLLDNTYAAILGITYCYLPFMIFPLYVSLEKIKPSIIEASYDLGAKPLQTFIRVVFPLSWPGVVAGCMLVAVPATGEFVIPELLGGSETLMIGKQLWVEFFNNRDWPVAASLTILTLAFLIMPIMIFQRFEEREVAHEFEA